MRDRLPNIDRDRQNRKALAKVGNDLGFAAAAGLRSTSISEEWTPSACSSSSARPVRRPTDFDFRHFENEPLGDQANAIRFRQRNAWIEQHVDSESALVEGRQEGARQQECGNAASDDCEHDRKSPADGAVLERPVSERRVAPLENRTSALSCSPSRLRLGSM